MASFGTQTDFDANDVEPASPRGPIPAGDYVAVIVESEEKPTSKGNGSYLQFTFEVVDGEQKGSKLWSRLNLNNPSDVAVGIARAELSAICRAVGVMKPHDSTDLHNLPLVVKVAVKKRADTGELTNEVKGYKAKGGQAAPAAAPAKGAPAPWKRG